MKYVRRVCHHALMHCIQLLPCRVHFILLSINFPHFTHCSVLLLEGLRGHTCMLILHCPVRSKFYFPIKLLVCWNPFDPILQYSNTTLISCEISTKRTQVTPHVSWAEAMMWCHLPDMCLITVWIFLMQWLPLLQQHWEQ